MQLIKPLLKKEPNSKKDGVQTENLDMQLRQMGWLLKLLLNQLPAYDPKQENPQHSNDLKFQLKSLKKRMDSLNDRAIVQMQVTQNDVAIKGGFNSKEIIMDVMRVIQEHTVYEQLMEKLRSDGKLDERVANSDDELDEMFL